MGTAPPQECRCIPVVGVWLLVALFARGLCWLLSKPQLQELSQQAWQACHSSKSLVAGKVVAGGRRKRSFPRPGVGALGFQPGRVGPEGVWVGELRCSL